MYSLESPHRGDSNEYTQHTIILLKIENIFINYRHLLPDQAPWLNLTGSNYPYLEQNSMVPKMFEPLKFDCNQELLLLTVPSRFLCCILLYMVCRILQLCRCVLASFLISSCYSSGELCFVIVTFPRYNAVASNGETRSNQRFKACTDVDATLYKSYVFVGYISFLYCVLCLNCICCQFIERMDNYWKIT